MIINGSSGVIPTHMPPVAVEKEKCRQEHDKIAAKIRTKIAKMNVIYGKLAKACA